MVVDDVAGGEVVGGFEVGVDAFLAEGCVVVVVSGLPTQQHPDLGIA